MKGDYEELQALKAAKKQSQFKAKQACPFNSVQGGL